MKHAWIVAAVGVLLARAAFGAVVYSGPRDIQINNTYSDVGIDMDGELPGDFVFEYTYSAGDSELSITGLTSPGRYFVCDWSGPYHGPVMKMQAGDKVDADLLWLSTKDEGLLAGFYNTWWGGRFAGDEGYVGVKLEKDDGWHYGWIGFQADDYAQNGLITGWAFEDVPDKPIEAGEVPEPVTLVLLAAGALLARAKRT